MSKELNETLVMTTCKCRENTTNLVISRAYFTEMLENKIAWGAKLEQERILKLLIEADTTSLSGEQIKGWFFALKLVGRKAND
jgi:hypothetical protein